MYDKGTLYRMSNRPSIWMRARRQAGRTRPELTLEAIGAAALAIADRDGLDADDDTKFLLLTAADDYTIGFALREIAIGGEPGRRFGELTSADFLQEMIEAGELPYLAQAGERGWKPPPRDFDAGLDVLLDGMNQLVERKRRELQTSKRGPVVDLRTEEDHDGTPERSRSRESGFRETSGN